MIKKREALLLYKSYIIPYFDNGNLWYGAANEKHLRGLQTLEKRYIRIITGPSKGVNLDKAHKELSPFKLNDREKISQLKFAHRSPNLGSLVTHTGRILRSHRKKLLTRPTANNAKFEKSFIKKA